LFVPWINDAWYIIFCCAIYELLNRSGNPALIEILKTNLQKDPRERIYNLCFVLSFLESILLGFIIAGLLNINIFPWQTLFGVTALIGLSSIFAQIQVPIPVTPIIDSRKRQKVPEKILTPWKEAVALLKLKPDFFRFQCGFMLGGIGLMLASPSLALFCVDLLRLSHAEITMGRSVLMGIGVTVSSYFWRQMLSKNKTDQLLRNVLAGFALYLLFLYLAEIDLLFFYCAFILYGIAQAGSHLLWNLSGPLFAGNAESSQYSRVNILTIGLRGAVTPALGGILCSYFGPAPVILLGAGICFSGVCYMLVARAKTEPVVLS
jgi:predicted MFS family arabinose efflux permease